VSALGGVRKLNLSNCTGVVDVSDLGHVRCLFLVGCLGVIDYSAVLHAVRSLDDDIWYWKWVSSYSKTKSDPY